MKPDYEFLNLKQGVTNEKELKDVIPTHCKTHNYDENGKACGTISFL